MNQPTKFLLDNQGNILEIIKSLMKGQNQIADAEDILSEVNIKFLRMIDEGKITEFTSITVIYLACKHMLSDKVYRNNFYRKISDIELVRNFKDDNLDITIENKISIEDVINSSDLQTEYKESLLEDLKPFEDRLLSHERGINKNTSKGRSFRARKELKEYVLKNFTKEQIV